MLVLGLDTGADGGIVVLSAVSETAEVLPVFAASWHEAGRWSASWTGREAPTGRRAGADTLVGVIVRLARFGLAKELPGPVDAVVFEGAYVGVNVRSALSGTRTCGRILGALESELWISRTVEVRELPNGSWWKLCGLPPSITTRDDRKEESVRRVPTLIPGLRGLMNQIPGGDHVSDAAALAWVGVRHGAHRGTDREWEARIALASGRKAKCRKVAKVEGGEVAPAPAKRRTRTAR